jgi:hypothetical protein
MPAPLAGIHVLILRQNKDVDGWNKAGHDAHVVLNASSSLR